MTRQIGEAIKRAIARSDDFGFLDAGFGMRALVTQTLQRAVNRNTDAMTLPDQALTFGWCRAKEMAMARTPRGTRLRAGIAWSFER